MQVSELLRIGRGVTALIGGGGKTSLMRKLAGELSLRGRVIVTTTTRIYPFADLPTLTGASAQELKKALSGEKILCLGSEAAEGKLGAPALGFAELAALADYVLVEADGARGLPLKAHLPHEPVIPAAAQRVAAVVGADAFGRPVSQVCHRSGLYASLAGVEEDCPVTPEIAAKVLLREGGFDRVFVNKVESEATYRAAEALGKLLPCPVIAGSLRKGVYVCLS